MILSHNGVVSDQPYIVKIIGTDKNVKHIFQPKPKMWLTSLIFGTKVNHIKEIEVNSPTDPSLEMYLAPGIYFVTCEDSLGNESFGEIVTADKGRNINSTYFESSASVTRDGNTMYFVSDRPGGKGQADIYRCERTSNGWSKPVNLGDSINSESDEISVYIHPSGQYLFFSSNNLNSIGSYDIFVSKKLPTGLWTKGKNLGYPINTSEHEINIFASID